MSPCTNCSLKHLLNFDNTCGPSTSFVGCESSQIWIIGINPLPEANKAFKWSEESLRGYFDSDVNPYFDLLKSVSPKLHSLLGKEYGVAHADLVKCATNKWPPEDYKSADIKLVIDHCKSYLKTQIETYKPKVIVCNGRPVSDAVLQILKPGKEIESSYTANVNGHEVHVILSGFIRRIDNYSKRRLGKEIEAAMEYCGID